MPAPWIISHLSRRSFLNISFACVLSFNPFADVLETVMLGKLGRVRRVRLHVVMYISLYFVLFLCVVFVLVVFPLFIAEFHHDIF